MIPVKLLVIVSSLIILAGCGLNEYKVREQRLNSLLVTNATLNAIELQLGVRFEIYHRNDIAWEGLMKRYVNSSAPQHKRIAQKLMKSHAAGHTSTITMQTWIFLDDQNRLIDYDLSSQ